MSYCININLAAKTGKELKEVYQNIHQDIIDRCKKGENEAQFQIYKLYYKAMYNTSYRILHDQMEAEDIMQEAFLIAFSKIDSYKYDASFGAWLKKIVVNKSINVLKKKKIQMSVNENQQEFTDVEDPNKEEGKETTRFNIESVKNALDELPNGYRIIISLYLIEGYDHEEISEILGISSATSRSQYNRGIKKLRQLVTQKQHG
ncbi:sigma-70 family RNA polymerase sigma factor [Candidatus Amoebophilus asiaticus]|nr:sigma-70 family RNA polymerase sigma factor [Candidatus Amoebophilus asiaticus]